MKTDEFNGIKVRNHFDASAHRRYLRKEEEIRMNLQERVMKNEAYTTLGGKLVALEAKHE